jgi:hypothetical protein
VAIPEGRTLALVSRFPQEWPRVEPQECLSGTPIEIICKILGRVARVPGMKSEHPH